MIAHGDQRSRRDDEGDVGDVGRVLRLADHARLKVADAVLGVIGLGRLGVVGVGPGRDRRADIVLDLLVLLDGRLDQVDPDRARPGSPPPDRELVATRWRRPCGGSMDGVWTTIKRYSRIPGPKWRRTASYHSDDTMRSPFRHTRDCSRSTHQRRGLLAQGLRGLQPDPEVSERPRDRADQFGVARTPARRSAGRGCSRSRPAHGRQPARPP